MKDYFSYNDGEGIVPDGAFRISPSQLHRFFDDTTKWYREFLLGEEGFTGNTATHLGTCVHAAAEMITDKAYNSQTIEDYITNIKDPDVDKQLIRSKYPSMVAALKLKYLDIYTVTDTELFVWQEIIPGVGIGGSIDRYDENTGKITDYKTMGSLDKARVPKTFSRAYWFQQMSYAWLLRKQGKPVNYVELVFVSRENTGRTGSTGKALPDYYSEVNTITLQITPLDMEIIENSIKLIAESVKLWKDNRDVRYILMQDYRCRIQKKEKPKGFK